MQTLLMTSGELNSFPETFLFQVLCPAHKFKRIIGWRKRLKKNLPTWNEVAKIPIPASAYRQLSSHSAALEIVETIDNHCSKLGYKGWIEKTPQHLRHIDDITSLVDNALFIHVIRDFNANVRSLNNVAEKWQGNRSTKDNALRVLRDREIHVKYVDQEQHLFICYDNLLAATAVELQRLQNFTGTTIPGDFESKLPQAAAKVCLPSEEWKANNFAERILAPDAETADLSATIFSQNLLR